MWSFQVKGNQWRTGKERAQRQASRVSGETSAPHSFISVRTWAESLTWTPTVFARSTGIRRGACSLWEAHGSRLYQCSSNYNDQGQLQTVSLYRLFIHSFPQPKLNSKKMANLSIWFWHPFTFFFLRLSFF